ncbi:HlyD family type I secretion periplasmic adaptor subunit [Chitinibacter sp. SCUT-21]|uniref:HlyD family type I secretion periplasmic adaptor subunit n=1 Tax=Chitinibacter sp. SCUT-21 TaxID=2970891 RepID=UPI0035A58274
MAYMTQLSAAYRARRVVWLCSGLVVFVVLWAAFAHIDEVVRAEGAVEPVSAVQRIQSLEGGIVRKLYVREGQSVKAGEALVELDDTHFKANVAGADQEIGALLARRARLIAEVEATVRGLTPISSLTAEGASFEALTVEYAAYVARLREIQNSVARADQVIMQQQQAMNAAERNAQTLLQSLALLDQEVATTEGAVKSGALPLAELRKLQRDRVRLQGDLDAARLERSKLSAARAQATSERSGVVDQFRAQSQSELAEIERSLAKLRENQPALADQLRRTKLVSPVAGKVKAIAIRTQGGVVKPGETILDIVPLDDKLVVEARVAPRDIAYVRPGLGAMVKFSAYDFTVYGGLKGTVRHVSADALQDEKGNPYYRISVETNEATLHGDPIIPGMQASVDVLTGKKSILSYWMKPLLRAKAAALRER